MVTIGFPFQSILSSYSIEVKGGKHSQIPLALLHMPIWPAVSPVPYVALLQSLHSISHALVPSLKKHLQSPSNAHTGSNNLPEFKTSLCAGV